LVLGLTFGTGWEGAVLHCPLGPPELRRGERLLPGWVGL
jgi:hypothetical protein